MTKKHFLAWCVHFYTALGLVVAAGMVVAILDHQFRLAFLLMIVATLIDATDGTLARLVRVKEVLPGFDGRRLDDLIDFQTYTSLPLLLIWRAGILPEGQELWLLAPLLASAYGFCQVAAKTDDGYFLGFPSYWNIIAFYVYVLQPIPLVTITILMSFAVLTFVPARYLCPTKRGRLNLLTNYFAMVWTVLLVWILLRMPDEPLSSQPLDDFSRFLAAISLSIPFYYLLVSWIISVRIARRSRRMARVQALTAEDAPPRTVEEGS